MKISDLWGSVYCTRFFSRFFHDLCTIGFGGSTCSDRLQPCHGHWSSTIPFDLISCGSRHCENALVARCRPNQLMYTVQVVRFPCPCWHAYVYAMYNMYSKYHVLLYVSCIFLCIYIYTHIMYLVLVFCRVSILTDKKQNPNMGSSYVLFDQRANPMALPRCTMKNTFCSWQNPLLFDAQIMWDPTALLMK